MSSGGANSCCQSHADRDLVSRSVCRRPVYFLAARCADGVVWVFRRVHGFVSVPVVSRSVDVEKGVEELRVACRTRFWWLGFCLFSNFVFKNYTCYYIWGICYIFYQNIRPNGAFLGCCTVDAHGAFLIWHISSLSGVSY